MNKNTNGTILVVDDEAEIREIVMMHLTTLGVELVEAGDGQAALELLRSRPVDMVVSDLMMPRLTGLSLLSAMRAEGFMQPFIFLTAYPSQDTTVQALRLGAFDYIEKPFEGDELRTLVKEALRVAKEMRQLGAPEGTEQREAKGRDAATQQIRKLRTLRYVEAQDPTQRDAAEVTPAQRKVEELFISEASAQLLFCEGSIKNLHNPDERAIELGYLFRVMQGIAEAAEQLPAPLLVELMRAGEHFYTALRVRLHLVSRELIEFAAQTNKALYLAVTTLGQDAPDGGLDVAAVRSALDAKRAELERTTSTR